ncbi:MAG TPA: ribosome-associated translation inhibitor RaiA [Actinomycetes bacterium]|nr:ribosome-associated translation inhibitor RaiA [Actinomycetes bacterium]
MEIVVRGRHMEISDRFREHVSQKLAKIERYDGKCHRVDVEVSQESNPRLADQAVRVEITCHGKGPVVRAEAAADEKFAALDIAYGRLVERMRRAADRRHDHRRSQGRALAERLQSAAVVALPEQGGEEPTTGEVQDGPLIVREKTHRAPAMTLDQALYEMELVGHDFFLFHDADSGTPSVVYRRKGYDYGVLHLELDGAQADASAS